MFSILLVIYFMKLLFASSNLYSIIFTGVLCQLPSPKYVCRGGDVTFICNIAQIAVTWLVTPAVGNVSTCTVIRDTTPTATCEPMDVFTAAVGGAMTSILSAQSVTDVLNGTIVECLDGGDINEEICIIGQRIIVYVYIPIFGMGRL